MVPGLYHNLARWNEVAPIHRTSDLYRVDAVLRGGGELSWLETDALGDVRGLRCLHLMCHIGTDSAILARSAGTVDGLDWSRPAVAIAREIADAAGSPRGHFVVGDCASLPLSAGTYDIVFVNWGSLIWMHDLSRTLGEIRRVLKTGGRLVIVDQHPVVLSIDLQAREPKVRHPYFLDGAVTLTRRDYADPATGLRNRTVTEARPTAGQVMSGLLRSAFRIVRYSEHDVLGWPAFPEMQKTGDRLWRWSATPAPLSVAIVGVATS